MSENKVTTIGGEHIPRENCRRIDGSFYKIGDPRIKGSGDCYKIGDRYYREDTGYIAYDEEIESYVTATSDLIKGIIGFDKDGPIEGYFSENIIYNVPIYLKTGEIRTLFRRNIGEENREYRYHRGEGAFKHISKCKARNFNKLPYLDSDYKYRLEYNCTDDNMKKAISEHAKANIKCNTVSEEQAKLLKNITFGLEFETVRGAIKSELCGPLGLIPLRDGSIDGLEYATIPLQGQKGLETVKLISEKLSESTEYDENCSLHLHLGGLPRDKKHVVAMFKMLLVLQEEMYSLFPIYKQYNFGVKRKNYTKPLPLVDILSKLDKEITDKNIESNFETIFSFLSMGMSLSSFGDGTGDINQITAHPSDPRGTRKWNIRTRYHWVNMIPILFGNKKTVEFRLHTPTDDFDKISSYIYLCSSIILYVKKRCKDILAGTYYSSLSDILYDVYRADENLAYTLNQYIRDRKEAIYFEHSKGNIKGNEKAILGTNIFRTGSSRRMYMDPPVWTGSRGRRVGGLTRSALDAYLDQVVSTTTSG